MKEATLKQRTDVRTQLGGVINWQISHVSFTRVITLRPVAAVLPANRSQLINLLNLPVKPHLLCSP